MSVTVKTLFIWIFLIYDMSWKLYCNEKNLIVFHPRKAGGSSVLHWMMNYAKELKQHYSTNVSVIHYEGYGKRVNMIQKGLDKYNNNGLFIIALRNPIERILSQYNYEWMWGCQKCNSSYILTKNKTRKDVGSIIMQMDNNANNTNNSIYKFSNIEFSYLIDRVEADNLFFYKIYMYNYYLWLFCCTERRCENLWDNHSENSLKWKVECLEKAKKMIESMDIVLVTEWLKDIQTITFVNKIINKYVDVDNISDLIFPHNWRNIASIRSNSNNKMISNDNYKRLQKLNDWDIKFYQYTKRLCYTTIQSLLA